MLADVVPITLEKAVEKYGISSKTLIQLGKDNKIAFFRQGGMLMVEENSIKCYLHLEEFLISQNIYSEVLQREKQEEIDEIISKYDDFLFSLRSLDQISPIFKLIVSSMSLLLPDQKMQKAFVDISLCESIYETAKNYGVSYDRMCMLYQEAIYFIGKKTSFLRDYRNRLAKLEYKVRELTFLDKCKNMEILHSTNNIMNERVQNKISNLIEDYPRAFSDILKLSLENDLKLEPRCMRALKSKCIYTIEDLYKYVSDSGIGFDTLLKISNLGKVSLQKLKFNLRRKGFLDLNDKSPLFDYINDYGNKKI